MNIPTLLALPPKEPSIQTPPDVFAQVKDKIGRPPKGATDEQFQAWAQDAIVTMASMLIADPSGWHKLYQELVELDEKVSTIIELLSLIDIVQGPFGRALCFGRWCWVDRTDTADEGAWLAKRGAGNSMSDWTKVG